MKLEVPKWFAVFIALSGVIIVCLVYKGLRQEKIKPTVNRPLQAYLQHQIAQQGEKNEKQ